MDNIFLDSLNKIPNSYTENGAIAYNDTCDNVLNRFSNLNNMFESYEDICLELEEAWYENPLLTLRLIMYSRAITRKSNSNELEVKGLGLKNVGRLSLKWLYNNHKNIFHKNLISIVEIGSYQDLWHKDFVEEWVKNKDRVIVEFLADKILNFDALALKYLPRYRSKSNILKAKNKENQQYKLNRNKGIELIVDYLNTGKIKLSPIDLMKIKSKGEGHKFQRIITQQKYNELDFNSLPGKVLTWITKKSSRTNNSFLERHNLENKYIDWLETQSNIKSTSYLYELIAPCIGWLSSWEEPNLITKYTVEKQIQTLLNNSKKSKLNIMPVLDTSGSMRCEVANTTALNIALSLAVYFSMLQNGSFKDSIIAFNTKSTFKKLTGSYLNRVKKVLKDNDYMGSTNFQSVIDLIIETRINNPNIDIKDYPEVYIVISDLQFNDTHGKYTNHRTAINKLKQVGLPEPLFIWYNVSAYGNNNYQNHKDEKGIINISGYDPSIINKLMSGDFQLEFENKYNKSIKDITPFEAMLETLSQDYLKLFTL